MMTELTLTIQELEAAHYASYDFGPGYPQLEPPAYLTRAYRDDTLEELSVLFAPTWSRDKQAAMKESLDLAVKRFLDFPVSFISPHRESRVTFSGSIALDRCLSASERLMRARGFSSFTVVTTTPCIDIMRLFLEERSSATPVFVPSNNSGTIGGLDIDALLAAIRQSRRFRSRGLVVLITSPENPTGEYWSADALVAIADEVKERGGVLIVDHTFLVSGVQRERLPRIWDSVPFGDWYAVWDTGKTFGLNEDKLGIAFCGSVACATALDDALAVLQFGVARRQQLFFSNILHLARYHDHLGELAQIARRNLDTLVRLIGDRVRVPKAGSMALIDVSPLEPERVRRDLLRLGVGVISGDVFFHDAWKPVSWVRLALAREPEHFREGAEILASYLDRAVVHV